MGGGLHLYAPMVVRWGRDGCCKVWSSLCKTSVLAHEGSCLHNKGLHCVLVGGGGGR